MTASSAMSGQTQIQQANARPLQTLGGLVGDLGAAAITKWLTRDVEWRSIPTQSRHATDDTISGTMMYSAQFMEYRRWTPGTVLVIPSDVPPFEHFLIVEFINFHTWIEYAIHSMPSIGVARAPLDEVIGFKPVKVYWQPQTPEQSEAAVLRMQRLVGHPYDLAQANCEHVIRWAITGEWKSQQVSNVAAGVLIAGAFAVLASL
jgi:hypothetical protein